MLSRLARFLSGRPETPSPSGGGLAFVLTGGGARAAYQAGVVRALARRYPALRPDILTGVSAGGLNAAFLAATADEPFADAADRLVGLWRDLRADDVFRLDRPGVLGTLARFVRRPDAVAPPAEGGLLDTTPLRDYVAERFGPLGEPIGAIDRAVEGGHLGAFALTTTSYTTGRSVTWVQEGPAAGDHFEPWDRPMRRAVRTRVRPEHVLASAALPFFFPAVSVADPVLGTGWHGDGGIRLTAPLAPALHLGADKVVVVSTRCAPAAVETGADAEAPYPSPARVLGVLLNAVFLDVVDRDAETLRRINALLAVTEPAEWGGFRPVDLLHVRPSEDLGALAGGYAPDLPPSMRLVTGGFSDGAEGAPDWLSMLLFDPAYVGRLVALGEADVAAQGAEIDAFLGAEPESAAA